MFHQGLSTLFDQSQHIRRNAGLRFINILNRNQVSVINVCEIKVTETPIAVFVSVTVIFSDQQLIGIVAAIEIATIRITGVLIIGGAAEANIRRHRVNREQIIVPLPGFQRVDSLSDKKMIFLSKLKPSGVYLFRMSITGHGIGADVFIHPVMGLIIPWFGIKKPCYTLKICLRGPVQELQGCDIKIKVALSKIEQ